MLSLRHTHSSCLEVCVCRVLTLCEISSLLLIRSSSFSEGGGCDTRKSAVPVPPVCPSVWQERREKHVLCSLVSRMHFSVSRMREFTSLSNWDKRWTRFPVSGPVLEVRHVIRTFSTFSSLNQSAFQCLCLSSSQGRHVLCPSPARPPAVHWQSNQTL